MNQRPLQPGMEEQISDDVPDNNIDSDQTEFQIMKSKIYHKW